MNANLLLISAEQRGAVGSCIPSHGRSPCSSSILGHVQADMVGQVITGLEACPGKYFFCMPLCRDLPSHVNTLIWANVPSLTHVTPRGKFQPQSFKINCKNSI